MEVDHIDTRMSWQVWNCSPLFYLLTDLITLYTGAPHFVNRAVHARPLDGAVVFMAKLGSTFLLREHGVNRFRMCLAGTENTSCV